MNSRWIKRLLYTLLEAILIAISTGCAFQEAVKQSGDVIELFLERKDVVIQGPTRGSTRRFQILFFQFGTKNSFLEAEKMAIEATDSSVLISRVRLKTFEGLLIPARWLNSLGIPLTDIPIVGWQVYHVGGVGVKLLAHEESP